MELVKKEIKETIREKQFWMGIVAWLIFLLLGHGVSTPLSIHGGNKVAVIAAIGAGIVMRLWQYRKGVILFMMVNTLLVGGLPLLSYVTGNMAKGASVVLNLSIGLIWSSLVLFGIDCSCRLRKLKGLGGYVIGIVGLLPIVMVAPFWFYFALNHKLLRPDIILTLYQTNQAEAWAYIQSQPIINWSVGIVAIFMLLGIYGYGIYRISIYDRKPLFNGGGVLPFGNTHICFRN